MNSENDKEMSWYLAITIVFLPIIIAIVALFALPKGWGEAIVSSLSLVMFLFLIVITLRSVILLPKRRKTAGELILTARLPKSNITLMLVTGVIYIFSFTLMLITFFTNPPSSLQLGTLFLLSGLIFSWSVRTFQKVEIRERGICAGADFVGWDEMESYVWIGNKGNILRVKLRKSRLLGKNQSWLIGEKDGEAVNQVMQQRVYYRGNANGAGEGVRL